MNDEVLNRGGGEILFKEHLPGIIRLTVLVSFHHVIRQHLLCAGHPLRYSISGQKPSRKCSATLS